MSPQAHVQSATALAGGLSSLARRGAAIITAALTALVVLAALPYALHARLQGDALAQRSELALVTARMDRASNRNPALTQADKPERMFLPTAAAGITLAAFQSLVNEAAARSGMTILRMQPLQTDDIPDASPFRIGVDASGSLEQLRSFLTDVESMLPIIIVNSFEIRPRAPTGAEAQPYPSEDLAVSLKLEAYAWRGLP